MLVDALKIGGRSVGILYPVILDRIGVPFLEELLYTKLKLELPGREGVLANIEGFASSF